MKSTIKHGTRTSYVLNRCRCARCTKANRDYIRDYNARKKAAA